VRSLSQPGSSAYDTGTQRAFGRSSGTADGAAAGGGSGSAAGAGASGGGTPAQPTRLPTIAARTANRMGLILLEALGALVLLVLIVWWTMFAGRDKGERRDDDRR
jgi:hypothetical protein